MLTGVTLEKNKQNDSINSLTTEKFGVPQIDRVFTYEVVILNSVFPQPSTELTVELRCT